MFEGTRVKIQVFTPDAETPISRQASVPVDENGVEFDDYSFLDLDGDPYYVVRAKIDIVGTTLRYETLQSGSFANVDDETGFNGLKVTLNAVADDPAMKLMGAEIVSYNNTLELPQDAVTARGAAPSRRISVNPRRDARDGCDGCDGRPSRRHSRSVIVTRLSWHAERRCRPGLSLGTLLSPHSQPAAPQCVKLAGATLQR